MALAERRLHKPTHFYLLMKKKPNSDKSWPFEGLKAFGKLRLQLAREFSPPISGTLANSHGMMPATVVIMRGVSSHAIVFGMN